MMENKTDQDRDNTGQPQAEKPALGKRPGILKILQSVMAGAIGVQSSKRQEEDFSSTSPWAFIIAGILFTVGFVVTLILIVRWVLAS